MTDVVEAVEEISSEELIRNTSKKVAEKLNKFDVIAKAYAQGPNGIDIFTVALWIITRSGFG